MSGTDHPCRAESFETPHQPQPSLERAMIGCDRVIGVLLGDVADGKCQVVEHARLGLCPVRGHFSGLRPVPQGPGEEPASGRQVALLDTSMSMTWLYWSMARYSQTHRPATFTDVSSMNKRSPGTRRRGRAASISSGANRCTHR